MNVIDRYFSEISRILDDVMTSQREALERAAEAIADATMAHRNVFTFGCSHAGLLSLNCFTEPAVWQPSTPFAHPA